jgi:uncharacterized protein YjdB
MADTYNVGDGVRITATFTDITGAINDPTTVTFQAKDPHGAVITNPATKQSTGIYYADLVLTAPGIWHYRWAGTGAVTAAIEGQLTARPSAFIA